MNNKMLTHDELQHLEHANKVLASHLEMIQVVTSETELLFNTYVPILKAFITNISELRIAFGHEITHIIQSTREIGMVTKNTQNVIDFCAQVDKLNKLLTPELIEKLQKVIK